MELPPRGLEQDIPATEEFIRWTVSPGTPPKAAVSRVKSTEEQDGASKMASFAATPDHLRIHSQDCTKEGENCRELFPSLHIISGTARMWVHTIHQWKLRQKKTQGGARQTEDVCDCTRLGGGAYLYHPWEEHLDFAFLLTMVLVSF